MNPIESTVLHGGEVVATRQTQLNAVYKKVSWRLLPFLLLCYFFAYLDRVNIGFAKLQMQQEKGE